MSFHCSVLAASIRTCLPPENLALSQPASVASCLPENYYKNLLVLRLTVTHFTSWILAATGPSQGWETPPPPSFDGRTSSVLGESGRLMGDIAAGTSRTCVPEAGGHLGFGSACSFAGLRARRAVPVSRHWGLA